MFVPDLKIHQQHINGYDAPLSALFSRDAWHSTRTTVHLPHLKNRVTVSQASKV
jgi:hypothetical protein